MVARLSLNKTETPDLYLSQLPPATARAFVAAGKLPLFSDSGWYLAGGTAMALQVGHRQSVDLDFFTPRQKFRERALERELLSTSNWVTTYLEKGTIYGVFLKAKMSFIAYPFFNPSKEQLQFGHIRLLLPYDIAAMKIVAISQRGRKRDFIDLYWYCLQRESLAEVVRRAAKQYPGQEHNLPHIIKSLTYFTDADGDPMPQTYFEANWKTVKTFFKKEACAIATELLA